jgi:chromosome segregation ATPase
MSDTTQDTTVLNLQLKTLHEEVSEMKSVLKDLATAITKLALIEERQANAAAALERAFGALERVESRVSALEKEVPANKRVSVWVDRAIWAGMGLLVMTVMKKSGLG